MPCFVKVLILAFIQGLTEFLPVSSSGHLVLAEKYMNLTSSGALLEIFLHVGTLISVLVYYRKRIIEICTGILRGDKALRYYTICIIVACVPAFVAYLLLDKYIEVLFVKPRIVSIMLCVTGAVLFSLLFRKGEHAELSVGRSVVVGIAQSFAMIPGISRSGSTIVVGRHLGLSPERAAEFSLLMSIPLMIGAALFGALGLTTGDLGGVTLSSLFAGIIVAAIVGYIAIVFLIKALNSGYFWLFGIYCLIVGVVSFLF